jgi:hypothetical protein
MEQLIEKLLTECGYSKRDQGISLYSKEDKSFFLMVSISEEVFLSLRNKDLIRDNQSYKVVLDGFKQLINTGDQVAVEKNTSLLVLVRCLEIGAIVKLQQQILLFEEDEYFFKKYVILYTDDSIIGLNSTPLVPQLRVKVKNKEHFNQFAGEGYLPELAEFLVVVQLFIKLPFLNFEHGTETFTPLSQKLSTDLGISYPLYTALLHNSDGLLEIDFTKPESEDRINELLSKLPND